VLRTATAGLAARLDFTLDDLEDVRMAVGEAAALVLDAADDGGSLVSRFWLRPGELTIAVSASAAAPVPPEPDGFAWTVLTTLARSASVRAEPGVFEVTLDAVSQLRGPEPGRNAEPGSRPSA
jgi:serine/threonine-protein kinase RsbW